MRTISILTLIFLSACTVQYTGSPHHSTDARSGAEDAPLTNDTSAHDAGCVGCGDDATSQYDAPVNPVDMYVPPADIGMASCVSPLNCPLSFIDGSTFFSIEEDNCYAAWYGCTANCGLIGTSVNYCECESELFGCYAHCGNNPTTACITSCAATTELCMGNTQDACILTCSSNESACIATDKGDSSSCLAIYHTCYDKCVYGDAGLPL